MHMDPKLTFSTHCKKKVYVANKTLGIIRRPYTHIDELSLKKLYTSLVRPHLEYGNGAWSPVFKKDAILLENVQRRATKMILALTDVPYPERLNKLCLPSLYYRRARGDTIQAYKHMTGLYKVNARYMKLDTERAYHTRQNFFTGRITNT